jgi:V-type H+-transporting ATPase subunit a
MYKEINPTVFACVTFPFLFGVMFGDIGHGSLILAASTILILFNFKLQKNNFFKKVLKYRYLFFMLSFFSLYCGLIYSDFVAIPINFPSCYNLKTKEKLYGELKHPDCVTKFGIDEVWSYSKSELIFKNSLKMKYSVIIGVL